MPKPLNYIIISPARNEAMFIELTIRSVIAQTVLPLKWIIVSDGSTDGTDEIVEAFAQQHNFIELLRMPERKERSFAGKVYAFRAGYERVEQLDHDVIVSLDADISFEASYFEFLLNKLVENQSLGVVGTPFQELTGQVYDYRFVNIEHVSGACQVFRRECFKAVGGYVPIKGGSIDHVAVISARMHGWHTRTFPEKVCTHHREMGTAQQGVLQSKFKQGAKDYRIGNHPLWEVFRVGYQMTRAPRLVGAFALGSGYAYSAIRHTKRPVSPELVRFLRKEQLVRLKKKLGLVGTRDIATSLVEAKEQQKSDRCEMDTSWQENDNAEPSVEASGRAMSTIEDAKGVRAALIVNADDWGRDAENTDRILDCFRCGALSSASGMVFMEDSERSAEIARENTLDIGLHLNFTTVFSCSTATLKLKTHQDRVSRYLRANRWAQAVYHPGLASSFEYLVSAQIEEFVRIFGAPPNRLDGHHHMHLCANVLVGSLLPQGTIVRRNFSFRPHEKGTINRLYRSAIDHVLGKRHRLTDRFFSLPPLQPRSRVEKIFAIARGAVIEVETHPIHPEEYRFLTSGEILRAAGDLCISRGFTDPVRARADLAQKLHRGNRNE